MILDTSYLLILDDTENDTKIDTKSKIKMKKGEWLDKKFSKGGDHGNQYQ
jgi:hypothetical protein